MTRRSRLQARLSDALTVHDYALADEVVGRATCISRALKGGESSPSRITLHSRFDGVTAKYGFFFSEQAKHDRLDIVFGQYGHVVAISEGRAYRLVYWKDPRGRELLNLLAEHNMAA